MLTLQNSIFQLSINPAESTWSLYGRDLNGPSLEDVQMGVVYQAGNTMHRSLTPGGTLIPGMKEEINSVHGPLRTLGLRTPADANGLRFNLTFALSDDHPLLLFKLVIQHHGGDPVYIDRIELLNAGFVETPKQGLASMFLGKRKARVFPRSSVRPHSSPGELVFFSNGWESWSSTRVNTTGQRMYRSRLFPVRPSADFNPSRRLPRNHFSSEMFAVLADRTNRTGILAGFLSQKQQFGTIRATLDRLAPSLILWANGDGVRLDPGAVMETDWACLQFVDLDSPDPIGPYLEAVRRENTHPGLFGGLLPGEAASPAGWCSWYHFYTNVTAEDMRRNLEAAASLRPDIPLKVIQLDDGYQNLTGDWFDTRPSFCGDPTLLAGEIKGKGFTPGLWIAPFLVHPKSKVAREHPEWLLKSRSGRPVLAGYYFESFPFALDLTVPEALDYAVNVIRTARREWGYEYLKLDHLFGAALRGEYNDPTQTRAQVMRHGVEALREAAGEDTFLVGCGCPLGSGVGLFDAMRIGTDVEERWDPYLFGMSLPFRGEDALPSAFNSIKNTLERSALHGKWWVNDPDCLLLRPQIHLTLDEVRTLASVIFLTGGSLLLSDDLPAIPADRLEILAACLPLIGRAPWVLDWLDRQTPTRLRLDLETPAGKWHLLGLFNWQDKPRNVSLSRADFHLDSNIRYVGRSFWDGKVFHLDGDSLNVQLPAHGSYVLALRPLETTQPLYLGSSLHISGGQELVSWESRPGELSLRLSRPGKAYGAIDLYLPESPASASLDGKPISCESLGEGVYRFPVSFTAQGELVIRLSGSA